MPIVRGPVNNAKRLSQSRTAYKMLNLAPIEVHSSMREGSSPKEGRRVQGGALEHDYKKWGKVKHPVLPQVPLRGSRQSSSQDQGFILHFLTEDY